MDETNASDPILELQRRAWADRAAGRLESAARCLRTALQTLDERGEGEHPDAANLSCELAALEVARRQDAQAEALALRALDILGKFQGADGLDPSARTAIECIRTEAQTLLATALRGQGRYLEAEGPCRAALRGAVRLDGRRSPLAAAKLNDLGVLFKYRGEYARALRAYGRAAAVLARCSSVDGELAGTLEYNLGGLAHARGDFAAAEPLVRAALARLGSTLGEDHPDVGAAWSTLGAILQGAQRFEAAIGAYEEALRIVAAAHGPRHPDVALVLANLAEIERARGRLSRAESLARRALSLRWEALGRDHPHVASSLNNLALVLDQRGAVAEAIALLSEARRVHAVHAGSQHPSGLRMAENLAALEQRAGPRPALR